MFSPTIHLPCLRRDVKERSKKCIQSACRNSYNELSAAIDPAVEERTVEYGLAECGCEDGTGFDCLGVVSHAWCEQSDKLASLMSDCTGNGKHDERAVLFIGKCLCDRHKHMWETDNEVNSFLDLCRSCVWAEKE